KRSLVNVPYLNIYFFPNRSHYLAQYEWPTMRDRLLRLYEMVKDHGGDLPREKDRKLRLLKNATSAFHK
ncbi:MAG TPA: hypothetical protein VGC95_03885, partial [Chitinophagaceae bacterium]